MKCTPGMRNAQMDAILANGKLSDMEKLQKIFDMCKEELRHHNVHLYYALLAVLDKNKKSDPGDYFNTER